MSNQLHQQPKGFVDSEIELDFDASLDNQDDVQERHHCHPLQREAIKRYVHVLQRKQALGIHPSHHEVEAIDEEHGEVDPVEEIFKVDFETLVVHLYCFQSKEEDTGDQAKHVACPDSHRIVFDHKDLSKKRYEIKQKVHNKLLDEVGPRPFKHGVYHVAQADMRLNVCSELVIDEHQVVSQLQLAQFLVFDDDSFPQAPQLDLQLLCSEVDGEVLHWF